jgi:hypothetical protein
MFCNVDVHGGTTSQTNVSVGMQLEGICADLDLNVLTPGDIMAGMVGGRVLNPDGSCGDLIEENRHVAPIPSGQEPEVGASCRYSVVDFGECFPFDEGLGITVCLPCTGRCRSFPNDITTVAENRFGDPAYVRCEDVDVEPIDDVCARPSGGSRPSASASAPPSGLLSGVTRQC